MQLKPKQNTITFLPTARDMLSNKEFQTLLLIKNGILVSYLAWIQLMQVPPTLNSTRLQVALQPVIAAFMAKPGLQSVGDLETMHILIEKNPKCWGEILSQKQEFSSFCDSTHYPVTNCLNINSRVILKELPSNKAYYSCT